VQAVAEVLPLLAHYTLDTDIFIPQVRFIGNKLPHQINTLSILQHI
jgi:hypothetical protein